MSVGTKNPLLCLLKAGLQYTRDVIVTFVRQLLLILTYKDKNFVKGPFCLQTFNL